MEGMRLENAGAYFSYFMMGLKTTFAYKADVVLSLLFRIATSIILVLVWSAVYLNTNTSNIGGFTLPLMYSYFFVYRAVSVIVDVDVSETMQNDIQSGRIAVSMIRPTDYVKQVISDTLGSVVVWSMMFSIPLLLIINVFVGMNLSASTIFTFAIELVLGMIIYALINFIIGIFAIYLTNIWGMINLVHSVISILAGALMPINLFPEPFRSMLMLLPFQMLGYTPAATLLGTVSTSYIIDSIEISILWIAILAVIAVLWWRRSFRKITSVGG